MLLSKYPIMIQLSNRKTKNPIRVRAGFDEWRCNTGSSESPELSIKRAHANTHYIDRITSAEDRLSLNKTKRVQH